MLRRPPKGSFTRAFAASEISVGFRLFAERPACKAAETVTLRDRLAALVNLSGLVLHDCFQVPAQDAGDLVATEFFGELEYRSAFGVEHAEASFEFEDEHRTDVDVVHARDAEIRRLGEPLEFVPSTAIAQCCRKGIQSVGNSRGRLRHVEC